MAIHKGEWVIGRVVLVLGALIVATFSSVPRVMSEASANQTFGGECHCWWCATHDCGSGCPSGDYSPCETTEAVGRSECTNFAKTVCGLCNKLSLCLVLPIELDCGE